MLLSIYAHSSSFTAASGTFYLYFVERIRTATETATNSFRIPLKSIHIHLVPWFGRALTIKVHYFWLCSDTRLPWRYISAICHALTLLLACLWNRSKTLKSSRCNLGPWCMTWLKEIPSHLADASETAHVSVVAFSGLITGKCGM